MGGTRRGLRRLRRALLLVVAIYGLAGAVIQRLVPGTTEVFPVFGWSLFSRVPNYVTRYTLVFHAQDGAPLEPPVAFDQSDESLVRGNRSIARKLISRLGRAHEKGWKPRRIRKLRRLLESRFLVGAVRYELVWEGFDPLEKWQTGASRERRSIAFFDRRRGNRVAPDASCP